MSLSDLPEVQDAVRQIPGVVSASVRWPDPLGPASLRVEFQDGVDQQAIGEAVIRTLIDVADVDLATMHLERANVVDQRPRPVFTSMTLDRADDELTVAVTLAADGSTVTGTATGSLPEHSEAHLVALATLDALHRTQAGPFTLRDLRQVELGDDGAIVTVVVDVPFDGYGQGPLVGAAMTTRDVRETAVRATLDAVNRILNVIVH